MGIEGGRSSAINSIEKVFNQQGNHPTRVLRPQPRTLEGLMHGDLHTFKVVATALHIQQALQRSKMPICLIGGLGVASTVSSEGHVYRTHHDIDFLIPAHLDDQILNSLLRARLISRQQYNQLPATSEIYTFAVTPRGGIVQDERRREDEGNIRVDLFSYTEGRDGNAYFDGGSYAGIDLGKQFPITPVKRKLMGFSVATAPKEVLLAMKKVDSQFRLKGIMDYEQLLNVSSN